MTNTNCVGSRPSLDMPSAGSRRHIYIVMMALSCLGLQLPVLRYGSQGQTWLEREQSKIRFQVMSIEPMRLSLPRRKLHRTPPPTARRFSWSPCRAHARQNTIVSSKKNPSQQNHLNDSSCCPCLSFQPRATWTDCPSCACRPLPAWPCGSSSSGPTWPACLPLCAPSRP